MEFIGHVRNEVGCRAVTAAGSGDDGKIIRPSSQNLTAVDLIDYSKTEKASPASPFSSFSIMT
jgi:hypothetical protein